MKSNHFPLRSMTLEDIPFVPWRFVAVGVLAVIIGFVVFWIKRRKSNKK